jgi:hypothetical protein
MQQQLQWHRVDYLWLSTRSHILEHEICTGIESNSIWLSLFKSDCLCLNLIENNDEWQNWRNDELEKLRTGEMTNWRNDELEKWRIGEMTNWRNDELEKWRTKRDLHGMQPWMLLDALLYCWEGSTGLHLENVMGDSHGRSGLGSKSLK